MNVSMCLSDDRNQFMHGLMLGTKAAYVESQQTHLVARNRFIPKPSQLILVHSSK